MTRYLLLILGAMSVLLAGIAIVVHFWVQDASPMAVLLVRIAALLAPFGWAALVIAGYREERRAGVRTYGAKAGLALLAFATLGATAAMLPGLVDAVSRLV